MNASLVMRSPKFRILLYILIIGVACLMVLLIHNSHIHLKEVESEHNICQKEKDRCEREKDSVSAQLQVLYERKKEMETLLQQERAEHQKIKQEMEKKRSESQTVQSQLEKKLDELQLKHSQLSNDYQLLKDKNIQIENKLTEMKQGYSVIEREKKILDFEVSNHLETLRQKTDEINELHEHFKKISLDKEQLIQDNSQLTWKKSQCDNKLVICEKQHHQLMVQFDEISLHLNNCTITKNFTSQEKLLLKEKFQVENIPHQNYILKFDQNNSNLNEKLVHIPDMKVSHPSEVVENNKNIEENVIGSEFNETLNTNISAPLADVNGGSRQLDVPITENIIKEKLNSSIKNISSNMAENTMSNLVSIQQENTPPTLNNQTEKTINQLPLPLPHINSKKVKIDMSINTTKIASSDANSVKVINDTDSNFHQKTEPFENIQLNKSSLLNSNDQVITLEFHPDQAKNKDYIRPDLQNNREIQFQKEGPFDNEINASRMDGDYNQDQQIDNMRADYDNDRNINRPDY